MVFEHLWLLSLSFFLIKEKNNPRTEHEQHERATILTIVNLKVFPSYQIHTQEYEVSVLFLCSW